MCWRSPPRHTWNSRIACSTKETKICRPRSVVKYLNSSTHKVCSTSTSSPQQVAIYMCSRLCISHMLYLSFKQKFFMGLHPGNGFYRMSHDVACGVWREVWMWCPQLLKCLTRASLLHIPWLEDCIPYATLLMNASPVQASYAKRQFRIGLWLDTISTPERIAMLKFVDTRMTHKEQVRFTMTSDVAVR